MRYAAIVKQVRDARQYTTNGGTLAVMISECSTCGAMPGMLCKSIYGGAETYAVHLARANAAADYLNRPLTKRLDVTL